MRSLSPATSAKLFATGFTVGPIVDSLHNQCLLKYDILPISFAWPSLSESSSLSWHFPLLSDYPYFFCSSWTVPPLLGIAYVVLGGILPRLFESALQAVPLLVAGAEEGESSSSKEQISNKLREKAWIAVATTAMIIKLSEFLQTHPEATDGLLEAAKSSFMNVGPSEAHLLVMLGAALSQWAVLDGTLMALLLATITAIGGPLSELPFVALGVWEYLPSASDYFPLEQWPLRSLAMTLGVDDYSQLALSSITGPCYFAVTMDAIALGRWFDATEGDKQEGECKIVS